MTYAKVTAALASLAITFLPITFLFATPAEAGVSDWLKGAQLLPQSTTDFGTDSTKQSIKNLHDTGANYVMLVIPLYQSNTGSTDIAPGWNTPSDASLAAATAYAHSLGMSVAYNIHAESYDGSWRAYINPGDRDGWFRNYDNQVVHFAQVAASNHAELFVLGDELVSMTAPQVNSTNTAHWADLISQVRKVYTGKLTYGANSNDNSDSIYTDEKKFVGFWPYLDYAGISAYYTLSSDGTVNGLKSAWNNWNNSDLKGFAQSTGKQVLITEVGYRSVDGAHNAPWDYNMGGNVNQGEQANDYDALMGYWNDYSYLAGVFFWNWSTNPNAGGNDTDYTPQHKQAQQIMQTWFSTPTAPSTPPSQPSFSLSANPNPSGVSAGTPVTLNVTVQNNDGPISGILVDIEVYDSSGNKAFQQFHSNQSFSANSSQTYPENWTPSTSGTYTVKVGVFSNDWSTCYMWNDNAAKITVSGSSTPPPTNNPPPTNTPPPTNNPPPATGGTVDIWWPTDGVTMSGTQPLKAMLENADVNNYHMYWQVDGGQRNEMFNSTQDYPHKEALVDFTGWSWKGRGPYTLTFIATDQNGNTLGSKSVNISTQ